MPLEITYYENYGNANMYGLPINSEALVISGVSARSAATPARSAVVRLYNTEAAGVRYSYDAVNTVNATAAAGAHGHYVPANQPIDIPAEPGWFISAIAAA